MAHGVDPECFALAEHFLNDCTYSGAQKISLAEAIQEAVEDWFDCNMNANDCEDPESPSPSARDEGGER
jgi:hypothetical protein